MNKEKLKEFIHESILDRKQFDICHELYGHCLAEHVTDLLSLQNKLWDMPRATERNPIVVATRFFSEEEALQLLYDTLMDNIDHIQEWRRKLYLNETVIEKEFNEPVGEGIVKGADRSRLIPMHKITIVLSNGDSIGQPFYIKTAYPNRTFDDNDTCYDAIDEFQSRRRQRNESKK